MKNLKKINLCLTALFAVILLTSSSTGLPKFIHDHSEPDVYWKLDEATGGYSYHKCLAGCHFSMQIYSCVPIGSEYDDCK